MRVCVYIELGFAAMAISRLGYLTPPMPTSGNCGEMVRDVDVCAECRPMGHTRANYLHVGLLFGLIFLFKFCADTDI